ncbi:MAG: hypothetical protein RIC55_14780 [Pirellulaceae bacterium]
MEGEPTYRRWRAPRGDAAALVDPRPTAMSSLLAENMQRGRQYDVEVLDRPLVELTGQARRDLIEAARTYTLAYRDVAAPCPTERSASDAPPPIILSGHQPELFHPGVWFKNFVLGSLAASCGAAAVNLVIDNDVPGSAAIRVPAGSRAAPRIEKVAYDRPLADVPYERRGILDAACFSTFAQRVEQTLAPLAETPLVGTPLVGTLWPDAVEAARRSPILGDALAQARHMLEGRWGLSTWELPLSAVCRQSSWRVFAAHLLSRLPRLHADYNGALLDYRRAVHLRSRTHPVPELAVEEQWREAPLWIWSVGEPRRRRLFAREIGGELELSDRAEFRRRIGKSAAALVEGLTALANEGVAIRPRALITTMFARLVLGDLFLHGIGGSKYDELTDEIIRRFFGIEPPGYGTVTATRLLFPESIEQAAEDELRRIDRQLRDLQFNPDRHLGDAPRQDAQVGALVTEKRRWITANPPPRKRGRRHEAIARINQQLQPRVEEQRRELLARRLSAADQLRTARLLGSREFSFCLFSETRLRNWLLELSAATS